MNYLSSQEALFFGTVLLGLILFAVIVRYLAKRTAKEPPPPSLTPEQQECLDILRDAMIHNATIRSTIRIETDENMVITFKLEKPEHFQVNSKKLDSRTIKKFL